MISLPFRVACILIAGFFIVLIVTYTYKFNNRKVFWGVGLTTIVSILILLGLGILRPSWGTETGMAVIVGICTAIGCAITLRYMQLRTCIKRSKLRGRILQQLEMNLYKKLQILNTTK